VQDEILAKNATPNLRVYVVWFDMLFGDSRSQWDGDGMTDPRVTHLWDEQKTVGNWYSANVTHREQTTWDFYALYGPDARDLSAPLDNGGTIIGDHDQLAASIQPLLGASG
jgi:hypothetical protein